MVLRPIMKSHSFGESLSPVHFRRVQALPVGYYTLFKGIATSKLTSWVSLRVHFLYHLATTLGP